MSLYTSPLWICKIGDAFVPGILQSIDTPLREINWQVQTGVAGVGAATIYRGTKLIEEVTIRTRLGKPGTLQTTWDEAVAEWDAFLAILYPNPLVRPPAFNIDHPIFARLRPKLTTVAIKANGVEKANDAGTVWDGVLKLIEYRPLKLATPAQPDPAQIDSRDQPPRTAAEQEIQDLLNRVNET